MASMEQNLINNLLKSNAELVASLEQAYRFVIRKQAHQGCMDAAQLAAAERDVEAHTSRLSIGRWVGDSIDFDLHDAKKALDYAKRFERLYEPASPNACCIRHYTLQSTCGCNLTPEN